MLELHEMYLVRTINVSNNHHEVTVLIYIVRDVITTPPLVLHGNLSYSHQLSPGRGGLHQLLPVSTVQR